MKVAIVVGTRPEVIKMAPVIRELQAQGIDFFLIHSNQHYSENMDAVFFKELNLPKPDYNLNVGSGTHSNQTGNILIKIEPILEREKPQMVLAQGDTNTVLAAALAAHKLGLKVGHIEAGLRSYDRTMPEESNRVVVDHIADFLFAVTEVQEKILLGEGMPKERIFVVGNTIVDAVLQNKELAKTKSSILRTLKLAPQEYCLLTAHRSGNVDTKPALTEIMVLLESIPMPLVWPIHVRTMKKIKEFRLHLPKNVIATDPLGYLDFLNLVQAAELVVTDSGGLQEEACVLGIPCITIRENTERPETVEVGANILVGRNREKLLQALQHTFSPWKNPFGDGQTAKSIVRVVANYLRSLEEIVVLFKKGQMRGADRASDEATKHIVPFEQTHVISVVGMGYMGLPTALLFAKAGYDVHGFDIDANKVAKLNAAECSFDESGIPKLLKEAVCDKKFLASTKIQPADVFIIAVPTPHIGRKCDLSFVIKAAESVASVAKDGNLVIIESTIKPGTCRDYLAPLFKKHNLKVDIVHCPERAIPGDTLRELIDNDRIIGADIQEGALRAKNLYKSFVRGEIFLTDVITAEAIKLMENTYRDVNIALANEFSKLADELGFDVWKAIRLANRHPRVNILQPGPGVGGHCIAIDPWFLTENTKSAKLITAAREVNDGMPSIIIQRLYRRTGSQNKMKIGVLGLAYKKNVDDARETPAEHIINLLEKDGHTVKAHDPLVKGWDKGFEPSLQTLTEWADALILVTDHDEYKGLKTSKIVVDTRNLLQQVQKDHLSY